MEEQFANVLCRIFRYSWIQKNCNAKKKKKIILNIFEQIQCIIDNLKKEFDIVPIFYRIMSDSIVVAVMYFNPIAAMTCIDYYY